MTQVRLIVDPLSIYKSGAPIISVDGSVKYEKFFVFGFLFFVFRLLLLESPLHCKFLAQMKGQLGKYLVSRRVSLEIQV